MPKVSKVSKVILVVPRKVLREILAHKEVLVIQDPRDQQVTKVTKVQKGLLQKD